MSAGILARLLEHSARTPHKTLYTRLDRGESVAEERSYAALLERVATIAAALSEAGHRGERALLLYVNPLEFIESFLACLAAGVTAVPVAVPSPRHLDAILPIVRDASVRCVLAGWRERQTLRPGLDALAELAWPELDEQALSGLAPDLRLIEAAAAGPAERIAFLQYTSGSTAQPKGVMVSHGNLDANERVIANAMRIHRDSVVVGWLPHYHDMGLIGNLLQPLHQGAQCVLMQPTDFIQKPLRWLRAISRFAGTVSGGPNFAYELCLKRIDPAEQETLALRHWEVAFIGAEPVRGETVARFVERFASQGLRGSSMFPCYGMAESTLFVAGARHGQGAAAIGLRANALSVGAAVVRAEPDEPGAACFIGCGTAAPGTALRIVDPDRHTLLPDGRIGEIWLRGVSVALGYFGNPQASADSFEARLADAPAEAHLRTGDLGTVVDGQLLIVGRLKDMLIVRGRNYYPQDVEACAQQLDEALTPGGGAVFQSDERVVLVHELSRQALRHGQAARIADAVRVAVIEGFGIALHDIVFIRPGQLPRTTSGKVRRAQCRRLYESRGFEALDTATPLEV
ncbi:MAG: fatty acyl-AMP ligase [Paraburkholderia tropica]|uniref:fatty acyl-AMP ligase n=1 Tax=Burkholderia gladioli TaxID=28095 RepID=UPI001FC8D5E1|nr:fatty acyl-AMP ligase [Burkholderia gladioli]